MLVKPVDPLAIDDPAFTTQQHVKTKISVVAELRTNPNCYKAQQPTVTNETWNCCSFKVNTWPVCKTGLARSKGIGVTRMISSMSEAGHEGELKCAANAWAQVVSLALG